jgi:hypothetical protein
LVMIRNGDAKLTESLIGLLLEFLMEFMHSLLTGFEFGDYQGF